MSPAQTILKEIADHQQAVAEHTAHELPLWRKFSSEVRRYREERGWSLADLADKIGIGRSLLSYLETGKRRWTLELARKAAKHMT